MNTIKLNIIILTVFTMVANVYARNENSNISILEIKWLHYSNNTPYRICHGMFNEYKTENRTATLKHIYSHYNITNISYSYPTIDDTPLNPLIPWPHYFKINSKRYDILPIPPNYTNRNIFIIDLLCDLKIDYTLKELKNEGEAVGVLFVKTENQNFAFVYRDDKKFYISFCGNTIISFDKKGLTEISYKDIATFEIEKEYYDYLIYNSYIWNNAERKSSRRDN